MTSLDTSQFWTILTLCVVVSSLFALIVLYYFRQQINSLDHKINSMFSLITSITNELNRLTMLQAGGMEEYPTAGYNTQIDVSDDESNVKHINEDAYIGDKDEDDEDDDDEDDDDEDEDDEDDDDDDDEDEDNNEDNDDDDDEGDTSKIIEVIGEDKKIHLVNGDTDNITNIKIVDMAELLETEDLIESLIDVEEIENDMIESTDVMNELTSDQDEPNTTNKSIEIVDYKKLPVKNLKEIVVEKGLVQNASKLSKKQLLELLEGN